MSYPNQYPVVAYPYTRDGVLNPSNPDKINPESWFYPQDAYPRKYPEDDYLLTVAPGQALTFSIRWLAPMIGNVEFLLYVIDNPVDRHQYAIYSEIVPDPGRENLATLTWTVPAGVIAARLLVVISFMDAHDQAADFRYRVTIDGGSRCRYRAL